MPLHSIDTLCVLCALCPFCHPSSFKSAIFAYHLQFFENRINCIYFTTNPKMSEEYNDRRYNGERNQRFSRENKPYGGANNRFNEPPRRRTNKSENSVYVGNLAY